MIAHVLRETEQGIAACVSRGARGSRKKHASCASPARPRGHAHAPSEGGEGGGEHERLEPDAGAEVVERGVVGVAAPGLGDGQPGVARVREARDVADLLQAAPHGGHRLPDGARERRRHRGQRRRPAAVRRGGVRPRRRRGHRRGRGRRRRRLHLADGLLAGRHGRRAAGLRWLAPALAPLTAARTAPVRCRLPLLTSHQ